MTHEELTRFVARRMPKPLTACFFSPAAATLGQASRQLQRAAQPFVRLDQFRETTILLSGRSLAVPEPFV